MTLKAFQSTFTQYSFLPHFSHSPDAWGLRDCVITTRDRVRHLEVKIGAFGKKRWAGMTVGLVLYSGGLSLVFFFVFVFYCTIYKNAHNEKF